MLRPTDFKDEVFDVLTHAKKGKGKRPAFMTAYQILNRLPKPTKDTLIKERGEGGKGHGSWDSAAKQVSLACLMLKREEKIEIAYLDTKDISVSIRKKYKLPSFEVCGLFKVK